MYLHLVEMIFESTLWTRELKIPVLSRKYLVTTIHFIELMDTTLLQLILSAGIQRTRIFSCRPVLVRPWNVNLMVRQANSFVRLEIPWLTIIHSFWSHSSQWKVRYWDGSNNLCRCHSIYHPLFSADGSSVITSGEKSQQIHLYSVKTGDVVSRGTIKCEPSSMAQRVSNGVTSLLAVAHSKFISLYKPIWG